MNRYFRNESGAVICYTNDDVLVGYGEGLTELTPAEVAAHLNPEPTYQQELTQLNAEWQLKVELYNKSFALAALADGPSEEAKKAAIRAAYEADKTQNAADRNALKVKRGLGGV